MMEEGEPEVHTTELTALSAAEKNVWQDELTSPITSVEGPDFVMEVQPGLANDSETKTIWNTDNQQQQQIQQPMRFQPFFKTISADSSFLPNASSLQDSRAFFFSPTLKTASDEDTSLLSSFPLLHPLTLKTASADDDTSLFSSLPLPTLKTASDDDTSILSSLPLPHPLPLPLNTASTDNDTSLLSSLPDFSASKRSSLEFTAAWVASTPFSDALKTPSAASTPPDNDGVRVDASGVDASGFDANEGTAAEPLPSYVAIKNPTATTTTSKMTAATMIGSMSGRKIRPTTTMMMGIAQEQQQQRQQQQRHHQSHLVTKAEQTVKNSAQNQPQFLANHHHHPQFITPTFSVTRFPTTVGPTPTSGNNNSNNNIAAASQFSSSQQQQQQSSAHFFVPAVFGSSTALESNAEVGPPRIPPTSIMYDSTTTRATTTTSNHHLGRHWKQMGCHTRQYVQPSIPLPASIRLASAAKQLRVAGGKGATSLGGPPGSLSPLTPNKSWAQVVASSTPQQKKQQNQQANNPIINNTSEMIVPNNNNGQQLSSSKSAATQLPPGAAVACYNKLAAMPPPPPPLFSGNGVGCGKPVKSASLRGLAGLGGVSTSSNRDFKSLLLRLKTVLEKEKEKWRPKAFVSGFGVVGGGGGGGSGGGGGGGDGDNGIWATTMEEASWPSSIKPCRGSIDGKQRGGGGGGGGDGDIGSIKPCRGSIDGKQRDECIFWLAWILRKLQFSAETMALSVALFDALIAAAVGKSDSITTTTATKYPQMIVTTGNCKLVALVCLLLSAKFSEEDSDVPTTKDFLRVSEINNGVGVGSSSSVDGSSSSAVGVVTVEMALKMERIILTALEWDLNRPTPLKFLEILHTLLLCHQPQLLEDVALNLTPAKHLQRLTWKMQKIVANHQLALSYRPAVLAVSLLSIDLESIGVADWQVVSQALEKICLIGGVHSGTNLWGEDRHKISRCKNLIVRLLDSGVDRNITSSGTTTTTTTSGGGGGVHSGASAVASALDGGGDRTKDKRSTIKLKRKHVPSESGGGGGGGSGGFAADNVNVTRERGLRPSNASSAATFSSSTTTSSVSSTSSSSRTTLKRVFNIAESPSCKSEARSDEEARGGGLSAAERFQALQGLCINIY